MARAYNPADFANHRLFQLQNDPGNLNINEFLNHMETRTGWNFTRTSGNDIRRQVGDFLRETPDGEFRATADRLQDALADINTHERIAKGGGSHLSDKALLRRGEAAQAEISKARTAIAKSQMSFERAAKPLHEKIQTFYSHHSNALERAIADAEGRGAPNVAFATLDAHTQAEVGNLLAGTRHRYTGGQGGHITVEQLRAAQDNLTRWEEKATREVESFLEKHRTSFGNMEKHLEQEAARVKTITGAEVVAKREIAAVESMAKGASTAEHAAANGAAKNGHWGKAAGGAAAGAAIAYVASDEENKARNSVIGGLVGGGLGKLLGHLTEKKTQLSHAVAGVEAKGLLGKMGNAVVSHIR